MLVVSKLSQIASWYPSMIGSTDFSFYLCVIFRSCKKRKLIGCREVCPNLLHLTKAFSLSPFGPAILKPHLQEMNQIYDYLKIGVNTDIVYSSVKSSCRFYFGARNTNSQCRFYTEQYY